MSIQSEINRIAGAKSDIADAIEDQGVTVPSGTKLDGMANLIGQISGGSEKLNSTQAADAYDPTATYAVGDKVSYAGNVYSCISAISTPEAWDSTHWNQVDPIQDQVDELRNTLNSEIAIRQTYIRPNLLDNWYFVGGGSQLGNERFPINQRALSIYSNKGYTVDRWNTFEGKIITIESDGLLIESTNQDENWKLSQPCTSGFFERLQGKEVTFSILFKGQTTGYIAACIFTNTNEEYEHIGNFETSASGIAKVTCTIPNNIIDFKCVIYGNDTAFHAKIVAMKLELGSEQTLAHQENGVWVLNEIPDYGEQLLKCQRYLQYLPRYIRMRAVNIVNRTTTNDAVVDFLPPLKQSFANTPSMSGGNWTISKFGGNNVSYNSITLDNSTKDIVNIRVNVALNAVTDAQLYSSTDVMFSCEP